MATKKRIGATTVRKSKGATPRIQTTQPWSQQQGEGAKPFAVFCAFRDMGPSRSLAKLAERGFILPGTATRRRYAYKSLRELSATLDWIQRAMAWDRHQDKINQRVLQDEGKRATRLSAKIARVCQLISFRAIRSIYKRLDKDIELIDTWDFKGLMDFSVRLFKAQKDLQEMNLRIFGQPTEIVAVVSDSAPGGLFSASDDFGAIVHSSPEATKLMLRLNLLVADIRAERAEAVMKGSRSTKVK